jgi:hypothetical protein
MVTQRYQPAPVARILSRSPILRLARIAFISRRYPGSSTNVSTCSVSKIRPHMANASPSWVGRPSRCKIRITRYEPVEAEGNHANLP